MLSRICRTIFWLYICVATLALLLIPMSEFGILGSERTPFSGIFAVLLAQPWLSLVSSVMAGDRIAWNVIVVGCCVVLNAVILRLICYFTRRSSAN
jgi:hypothetical protein